MSFKACLHGAPGTTSLAQHHIKRTSDQSVRSRPYPVPYSLRESLKKDIADIDEDGSHKRIKFAAGMTIRPSKCLFGVTTVDFLGHRLEVGGRVNWSS